MNKTQRHARAFASNLEAHASALRESITQFHNRPMSVICDAEPLLRSAADLIRDLASNALPDWESINSDRTLTPESNHAQVVAGWSDRAESLANGGRLMIASEWIKSRDLEIGDLRAKLARAVPFGAFVDARREPYAGEQAKSGALYSDPPSEPQRAYWLPKSDAPSEDQRAHWQAMEHQTRRIADALALRALATYSDSGGDAWRMLRERIQSDASK